MLFKKIISSEGFWVILMIVILYAFAYTPIINRYLHPLPERTYLGFNAYAIDPLGYIATAEEGYNGRFTRIPISTSAIPAIGFFVRSEYLLVGHLARLFQIHPLNMMKIIIVIISLVYLYVIWRIIRSQILYKPERILSYFLTLFATGVILPGQISGGWFGLPIDSQIFQRTTVQQPHYMLSSLFILLSIYFLSQSLSKRKLQSYILSIIFGFLSVQIFFPPMMVTICGLGIYMFLRLLQKPKSGEVIQEFIKIIIYCFVSCLPLIQLWYSTKFFDMNTFINSENIIPTPLADFTQYLLAIGLFVLPAVLAIPIIFQKKQVFMTIAISWIIAHPLVIFVLGKLSHSSQIRFFQIPYYLFYGIISVFGLSFIFNLINKKSKLLAVLFIGIFIICLCGSSIKVYQKSLRYTEVGNWDISEFGYPNTYDYQAMMWLNQYCRADNIILSDAINGSLLLALTPCRVFMSDWVWKSFIPEGGLLEAKKNEFYEGLITPETAEKFVKDNNISYIYYSPTEQGHHLVNNNSLELSYPFLEKIYNKDSVIIYKTN